MKFHFSENEYMTVVNNAAHRREEFSVEENDGYLIINVIAESTSDQYHRPEFAVIGVKEGGVKVFGNIQLVRWGDDYDVIVKLFNQPFYTPPTATCQAEHRYGNNTFTATVYNDGHTRFLIETADKTARFDLPDVANPEIRFQPTNLGFLTVLTAKCEEDEYLLLLLYDGEFKKIFETTAEKITYSPRSFSVTENLRDMLGRKKISSYSFSGTSLNSPDVTFEYSHDKLYPTALTPYLLLEALRAGDTDKSRIYLSEELSDETENLKGFFGNFTDIVFPKYKNYQKKDELTSLALLYAEKLAVITPRIFHFKMENGKICNISD